MTSQKDSVTSSLKPLTGSRAPWIKVDLYVLSSLLSHRTFVHPLIGLPEPRWSNDPDKRSGAP